MQKNSTEVWRPVPGYEGFYEVSDSGRVRSLDRIVTKAGRYGGMQKSLYKGRIIKQARAGRGYWFVGLHRHGKVKYAYVHRLVLEAYIGACPKGMECRHLDGSIDNNHLQNLKWGTHLENEQDKNTHGTRPFGELHHNSKLTKDQVKKIRALHKTGRYSQMAIARLSGIGQTTVSQIIRGLRWRSVCP